MEERECHSYYFKSSEIPSGNSQKIERKTSAWPATVSEYPWDGEKIGFYLVKSAVESRSEG